MFDVLGLVAAFGGKALSVYVAGYLGFKVLPKPENYRRLMRVTFLRTKLFLKEGEKEVFPRLIKQTKEEWWFVFKYHIPPGMSVQQFQTKAPEISAAFNGEAVIHGEGNQLTIEVLRRPLPGLEYYDSRKIEPLTEGVSIPIPLGYGRKGLEVADLAKAPHGIDAGESGEGKSVFLRQVITTLVLLKSPEQVRFTLIDLKGGVELGMFKALPHIDTFVRDIQEVGKVLSKVSRMLDVRGEMLERMEAVSIEAYNRKALEPLPYHVVVIDEMAEVEDTTLIQRIARLGRFCGVHLLMATQRPDANVFDGQIKANTPLRVCFRTVNGVNSRIILDNEHAAKLPPIKGRAIVQQGTERQVQALMLDEEVARKLIAIRITELGGAESDGHHEQSHREGRRDADRYF